MEHQISIFGTWNLDQTEPNFLIFNLYASAKHATNCTCTQPWSDHSSVHMEVFCIVAVKAVCSKLNFTGHDNFSRRSFVSNCIKTCAEVLECYVYPVGCEHIYKTKVVPFWITSFSNFLLAAARSTICSSMVAAVTNRYTTTGRVWPMRWQRSWACKSTCGFCKCISLTQGIDKLVGQYNTLCQAIKTSI